MQFNKMESKKVTEGLFVGAKIVELTFSNESIKTIRLVDAGKFYEIRGSEYQSNVEFYKQAEPPKATLFTVRGRILGGLIEAAVDFKDRESADHFLSHLRAEDAAVAKDLKIVEEEIEAADPRVANAKVLKADGEFPF